VLLLPVVLQFMFLTSFKIRFTFISSWQGH